MEIRPATEADLSSLAALMAEENDHYEGGDAMASDGVLPKLDHWFNANTDTVLLVAVEKEHVLAHATLVPLFPAGNLGTSMFIKDLYVAASARGCGIGEAMMRYCAAEAVRRGASRLELTVDQNNPRAERLYEQLGGRNTQKTYLRWDREAMAALAGETSHA